jgi:predicted nucleic acid-binding protein
MTIYGDANLLVRFYLDYAMGGDARRLLTSSRAVEEGPLPVTMWLRLEFMNALQRLVFDTRQGGQWRVTAETAAAAWEFFEEDLSDQVLFQHVEITLDEIAMEFANLVGRHTARFGFRTYDIMHVASALCLGCNAFWSFDNKARQLAKLEGLQVNK